MQITLAQTLGVDQYGTFTYAVAFAFLLATPSTLGLRTTVVRLLPSYCIQHDYEKARGLVRFSLFVCITVSISIASIGMVVVYLSGTESRNVLLLAMLLIPLLALSDLYMGLNRGMKRMVMSLAPSQVIRPTIFIVLVLIASYRLADLTSTFAIALMFTAICMALTVPAASFSKVISNWPVTKNTKTDAYNWLKIAIAFFIADSFYEVLNRIDIIMLGAMYDESASGIYNVAARTSGLVSFVISAVNSAAASRISEIYTTDGSGKSLQTLVTTISRWVFFFSILIAVLLIALGKPILSLFGEQFIQAYPVLIVCIIGQVINAFAGSVGMLLNMTGNHTQVAKIYGWSAFSNVLLNAILIPKYGVLGAAYATLATTFMWNVWMVYVANHKIGINTTLLHKPS